MSLRALRLAICLVVLLASPACADTLTVSPAHVALKMATTGPLAPPQTIQIASSGPAALNWTATVSPDAPWIALSAPSGSTPATIRVGAVDWRAEKQPPGEYSGKVTFAAPGAAPVVLTVSWTVVARLPSPKYTYIAPVKGCTNPGPYPDPAVCTVPDEKPPGLFQPPPLGGTYTDPNFGATLKILTAPDTYHTYSANNPLSANNKYLMTYLRDGKFDVVDVATGKIVFPNVRSNQNFSWDSDNDSVYYFLSGTAVIRHDLAAKKETTLVDYARGGRKFTAIGRGGTSGASKDNWLSFFAPNEKQVCALDLNAVRTYCADYGKVPGVPFGNVDYVLDSKGVDRASGKRYVILVAGSSTPAIYSVNSDAGRLDFEYRGPEDPDALNGNRNDVCDPGEKCMYPSHSDTLEDSSGTQYLVYNGFTNYPCEVATSTYQLNKVKLIMQPVELGGGRRKVLTLWNCPFPNTNGGTDEHVGCARKAPYCVISTVSPRRSGSEPPLRFPHATEIIVMRDNGAEIRRLAESRSVRFAAEGDESYWAMPRAAISNDGSLVVFDSNFGIPRGVRAVLVQTGFPNH